MTAAVSNPSGTSTSVPITLTLNPTPSLSVDDENTIRTAILTTLQADYAQQGLTVNVEPGSDYYKLATALARQGTVIEGNAVVQVDNFMPDSTQDIGVLARWMAIQGIPGPRGATGSYGVITIVCSAPSPVEAGQQLTDSLQQVFQVTQAGTYANGAQVPVAAVTLGSGTDHLNGDTLTWVFAPPYCQQTATVGTTGANDGLVGGFDSEDLETARARYLMSVGNPMGGGNWSQVIQVGAAAAGAVCGTGAFSAAGGPSTMHVACWGYATNIAASNAKLRALPSALMTGTIGPYIQGKLAEYAEVVVTTVADLPIDVAIGLTLPASPSAAPAGTGGGWVDGAPWPTPVAAGYCAVTAVTSATNFTVSSATLPIAGTSSISMLDPQTWKLNQAHVVSFTSTGSLGAYSVTIQTDAPLVNVAIGCFIFPTAQNTQTYCNAALGAFANMGSGEKTSSAGLLPRAYRRPLPNQFFPYAMDNTFLKALTASGPEVVGSKYLYTSISGWPATTTPPLPIAIGNPPNIFGPRNIGFWAS